MLSRLDGVERLQDQLDDAVRFQLGHADQLADGRQNYPEGRMREKFHGRHVMLCTSLYPYESSAGGGRIY